MAELRDQLVLDIDSALRSVDELGDSINRTLSQVRDVQIDDSSFRTVDERLQSIEQNVSETSSEISELELAAGRSATNFERLARELDVSENEARRLSQEILEGANSARRLESEAQDVARQLGLSETEARQFVDELSRGPREVQQIDDRVGRLNQGFARMRTLIVGAVAAFGVRGLVNAAGNAIDSFNSLNESVNAVNVTFGEGADIIFEFGERSARSAGLARGAFQQAVVPIGALLQNFGFDARESASAAVELTQRAADLASVFNTDVNDALDAIGSALRGETEPIRRYGVDVSQAAVAAQALSTGLVDNISDLEGATLATGRLNEILRQTDRVAGDFARTIEDPANAVRALAGEFEDAKAGIGEALIPAFQELLEEAPDLIDAIEEIGPAIGGIASAAVAAAPAIVAFVDFVLEQIDRLTIGLQLGEVREELADALDVSGEGVIGDLIGSAEDEEGIERLQGQVRGLAETIQTLLLTDADQQFNALFNTSREVEEEFAKIEQVVRDLDTALDDGTPKLDALSRALGEAGRESTVTGGLLEVLQRRVGLADDEFASFLTNFLDSSQAIGLSADELQAINNLLAIFAFESGGAEAEWRRFQSILERSEGIAQLPPQIDDGIVSLQELRDAADEAGISISEALGSDLFDEGVSFSALAQIEAQVEGFRDRINAIGPTINPLEGAAEAVEISVDEFLTNITEQFTQAADFENALTELAGRGFDALADALRGLGPGALGLVEDFLADAASAQVAENIFDPAANAYADNLEQSLRRSLLQETDLSAILAEGLTGGQIETLGLSQTEIDDLTRDLVNTPAAGESGAEIAENLGTGFNDYISQNAAGISLEAVQDLSSGLVDSAALQEAIDSGRALAEAVNQGFVDNLRFDFNIPTPTPQTSDSGFNRSNLTDPDLSVGGITVNQTVNTTPEREQTDVARSGQLAGAIATNIRGGG